MPARCPLLGYAMRTLQVEGAQIASWFLRTETQPEIDKLTKGIAWMQEHTIGGVA